MVIPGGAYARREAVTLPQKDHPLTEAEIELFNCCARTWGDPGFVLGSLKTPLLRDEMKERLRKLAEITQVHIDFALELGQHFVYSHRPRKKENTP